MGNRMLCIFEWYDWVVWKKMWIFFFLEGIMYVFICVDWCMFFFYMW